MELTEEELDYIMPRVPDYTPAPLPDVNREALEITLAIRLVARPELASSIDPEILTDDALAALVEMVKGFPAIAGEMGALGLACVLHEDPAQVELIEWLRSTPESVQRVLPSLSELLAALSRPAASKRGEQVARVIPPRPNRARETFREKVERARAEARE